MSWRDRLRPASFRGVPFYFEQSEGTTGRRTVVHEYPLRDLPLIEDLGQNTEGIDLDAYVLGSDYMQARDALLTALRVKGPGVLVHPTLGELSVSLNGEVRYTESTKEGGMCRFRLNFVQDSSAQYPTTTAATQDLATASCDAAKSASVKSFLGKFKVLDQPLFVLNAAREQLGNATAAIGEASRLIRALPAGINEIVSEISAFSSAVTDLINTPAALANRIFGLYDVLVNSVENPLAALDGLREIFSFGDDDPTPATVTPARAQQAANQQAVADLVQQATVIAAVRAVTVAAVSGESNATAVGFDSYDQAIALRNELVDQLDRISDSVEDDELFSALADMRVALCRDIAERTADLARLQRRTLQEPLPALVLAYRLYGSIERADDVVARNRVANPLFVPAGKPLEMLA